ncbi:MAG TPA: CARDB domain-containing protein, partial [Candidatus Manganitrophaceae bacterium]
VTTRTVASLAAGASNTATTSLTMPTTIQAGIYHLCALADSAIPDTVDETDENNNTFCNDTEVVTVRPADLIVNVVSTTSVTAKVGERITVQNSVQNIGGAGSGPFTLALSLSRDAFYGGPDDLSLTHRTVLNLTGEGAASTSTAFTIVQIPTTASAGDYYICALADSGAVVTESSEGNNTLCSSSTINVPKPDLIMTALTTTATSVAKGGSFSLSNTVKNQGGSVAGNFSIRFVLSPNAVIGDADDVSLSPERGLASLGVGVSSAANSTLTVPPATPSGIYQIGAIADVNNTVDEEREDNNTLLAPTMITVP